ncbi:MAG: 2-hydroxymuconic semialdehyde dehydrogenase [Cryomorphaceae bacterium BACL11 MAG-121001-bin54]|jgi:aminomuconate-semialdehyde/2-hydroxymuconate-6-semialdehyde dehydrogenase|nr:MAG: 2-hydroxymuconic semialdehyde dehydrogenase [Cryomorphaceae bacterium BACL11 MAG-121001-bin54]KRO64770.1 MAG: 2-hydroxymuconic semialdehyde dehydrogenase [Cryomorphaceae bacterium BACL11 MAG-121015-bin20]MDA0681930.1 aldehyde dehydrogenase [Bacteroidota bacterium]
MEKILNYINGNLIEPTSGKYLDNYNPSNGKVYSLIPDSEKLDIDNAVAAAKEAFITWSKTPKQERSDILMKIADTIEKYADELVKAESKDNGKPETSASHVDIPRASANIRFFAGAILHDSSQMHEMDGMAINYTLRQPVGVAACISPWNLPLYLLTWKIAPALAAGNTVVAKPSEVTPMTAYLFSKICIEAGLPKGVLNIVHGLGSKTGDPLTTHPDTPIISFTGGTVTGKHIATITAPMFKKLSLELGGKNPNIIFADADFDKAVSTAARAAFTNQGQVCLCGSRLFVEQEIYDKFKDALVAKTAQLKVGDPKDASSNLGAVVSKEHMHKILDKIEEAKNLGGKILIGGKRVILDGELKDGYYIEPTIIEGLSSDCSINQEEIFGPVVSLIPFKTEEEVIKMANSTKYGLSASIFTENISKAHRVAANIDSGVVWINTWLLRDLRIPFGGMKHSGVGREGGFKSLEFFTESKNICVKI